MSWLAAIIITGITAFTATNIDDIFILMFFFSQVNSTCRLRHIIVGQYLGFTAIIIASLPGFLGGLIIPKSWIGILGFVPIIVGIKSLINLINQEKNDSEILTISPQFTPKNSQVSTSLFSRFMAIIASIMNTQTYNVATITFANGGDNIGIYVPLFASLTTQKLLIILGVFYSLVGCWCYLAYKLTRHRTIAYILTRYGKIFTPFILISLGIFILVESETYRLFIKFFLTN